MIRRDRPPPANRDDRGAYSAALAWIARRELSTVQLRVRLAERGFPSDAIDATIDRLVASGALDDSRAARALARTEARKHRGPARIRQALEQAGVGREAAREALAELLADTPEREGLERAYARRWRHRPLDLSEPADVRRARAYLARQGFSASAIGDFLQRFRRRRAGGRSDEQA
jgi:regulatory protein